MEPKKPLGKIAFILDEKISWDRAKSLTQTINSIRRDAQVELLRGATTEEELIARLRAEQFRLVILPWHQYLSFAKLDSFLGKNRASGPTTCGYFAEPTHPEDLPDSTAMQRLVLFDFYTLSADDIRKLVQSIGKESQRSGIRNFLKPETTIYCESWFQNQGLGERLDIIQSLPEYQDHQWKTRSNAIRLILMSLWSLVYEHGPGKGDRAQSTSINSPKAYFQIGIDAERFFFKLFFPQPNWKMVDLLKQFWPGRAEKNHSIDLLSQAADFIRVHTITNAPELEITIGLLKSQPAQRYPELIRSTWIEPISVNLITEKPFEAPGKNAPHLKALPAVSLNDPKPAALKDDISKVKDQFITEANTKIRDLQKLLVEKDEKIKELRLGGVSTAPPLPPQDIEGLLETFQQLYFDARYQIRQFEVQIQALEASGNPDPSEVKSLQRKMTLLIERERSWLQFIAETMKIARETKGQVK